MKDTTFFTRKIEEFITPYLSMKIDKKTVTCPYWMNKLKNGKVVARGIYNGKGTARQIQRCIQKRLEQSPDRKRYLKSYDSLVKFARSIRAGIDCSGLAYRILNKLIQLNYHRCSVRSLNDIFEGGFRKTNSLKLTSEPFAVPVRNWQMYRMGDLIRINGAHHVAVILSVKNDLLTYIHSSWSTEVTGVHKGTIRRVKNEGGLTAQKWDEKTKIGENFGEKYFHQDKGDGVYRLKIFYDNG